jgi:branched-chain amino acid transport system permease protein
VTAKVVGWVIIAMLLVVGPLAHPEQFYLNVAILILVSAILALALHLVLRVGYVSLAQAAFMGIGAYTSALLTTRWQMPFAVGILCAGAFTAVAGYLLGRILFRLRGVYFVLVTFALGEVVRLCFIAWEGLFGGANGITGIPKPALFGFVFDTKLKFYYLALAVTVASVWFMCRVFLTHPGRAYEAINEAENLAESTGIDTTQYKVQSFTISCFFTGIAGSLTAHYLSYVSPSGFTFWQSVDLIIMNVLGGIGHLAGPIIGAILLVPLPELFRAAVEYQRALYGLTLILIVCFLPEGIAGAAGRFRHREELRSDG